MSEPLKTFYVAIKGPDDDVHIPFKVIAVDNPTAARIARDHLDIKGGSVHIYPASHYRDFLLYFGAPVATLENKMLNHPSQSPSWHGRYPRTLDEAFGPGTDKTIHERRRVPRDPIDWPAFALCGLIAALIGAMIAFGGVWRW